MLADAASLQELEAIAGGNAQVFQSLRLIEHSELSKGDDLDISRQPSTSSAGPDQLRFAIREALNHSLL
jgi:hypothetical protein